MSREIYPESATHDHPLSSHATLTFDLLDQKLQLYQCDSGPCAVVHQIWRQQRQSLISYEACRKTYRQINGPYCFTLASLGQFWLVTNNVTRTLRSVHWMSLNNEQYREEWRHLGASIECLNKAALLRQHQQKLSGPAPAWYDTPACLSRPDVVLVLSEPDTDGPAMNSVQTMLAASIHNVLYTGHHKVYSIDNILKITPEVTCANQHSLLEKYHGITMVLPWYTMVNHGIAVVPHRCTMVYHSTTTIGTMVQTGTILSYHGIPWYTCCTTSVPWYTTTW